MVEVEVEEEGKIIMYQETLLEIIGDGDGEEEEEGVEEEVVNRRCGNTGGNKIMWNISKLMDI